MLRQVLCKLEAMFVSMMQKIFMNPIGSLINSFTALATRRQNKASLVDVLQIFS